MTFTSIFSQLGYAGIALILTACFALYLAFRTFFYLGFVWKGFKKDYLNENSADKEGIAEICQNSRNPIVSIIGDIVYVHANHSEDIRTEVAYLFHRNFEHVVKSLTWLRLIAAIAPLLGLLGTVMGMVSVFRTIAENANPSSAQLAGGIWEALTTTIMGLAIAIPVLIWYYYLMLKFKAFQMEAVEHSYRALEICTGVRKCARRHH